ncbi:MAG: NADH-quinone oxidoreductase subunit C [Roseiflexus sp.]|nr:NADH-quinone oxidoreductase subunit C [Roseiflexus sp.]MBO9388189.1 NADH-quinone oxidoreductase subunit C [Roseiflexus sp.]
MPKMSAAELKERLARDLPGVLMPTRTRTQTSSDSEALVDGGKAAHPKRGEHAPVDLLATDDAVVYPERLQEVARYVRDVLGYELLSNITAVDYLADGVIEMVYHFFHLGGGPALVIKTRVPRDHPVVPSLTNEWPGANLQEREAFDLFGVVFTGHPNLTRIYMWDEFEGWPMRKDFPKQGDKYFGDSGE